MGQVELLELPQRGQRREIDQPVVPQVQLPQRGERLDAEDRGAAEAGEAARERSCR